MWERNKKGIGAHNAGNSFRNVVLLWIVRKFVNDIEIFLYGAGIRLFRATLLCHAMTRLFCLRAREWCNSNPIFAVRWAMR